MTEPRGHLKIYRKFFDDDPWWNEDRPRTKAEAWLDLLAMASWKARTYQTSSGAVALERGEVLCSLRHLAARWQWTVKAVRGWVETGKKWARIKAQREAQAGTVYLIVNYDYYQAGNWTEGTPEGSDDGTPKAHQGHSEGTYKKQVSSKASKYSADFLTAWAAYPARPNNNRAKAAHAWSARITEGEEPTVMLTGTLAYAAWCKATGKTGSEFVKQAATFYGPTKPYADPYPITPTLVGGKPALTRDDHLRRMGMYVPPRAAS